LHFVSDDETIVSK